jgi:hypothetical protein
VVKVRIARGTAAPHCEEPMGRFFLFIIAISILLVLGTALLVTYF